MEQTKRYQQIILWIAALIVIFAVATIFGFKVLYGVVIPQANNLAAFSTIGILGFAFIAGLIANFGPCSLGVLPAYMSFYLGMDESQERHSPIKRSVKLGTIASLGVFSFFIVLGLLLASVGTFLAGYATQLKFVIAILIFFIGVAFFRGKSIDINVLGSFRDKVSKMSRGRSQAASLFGFGIVYGAGGLMCFLPYLEQVIDQEVYREKKAKLLSEKKSLEEQSTRLEQKRTGWLEPMAEWIKEAESLPKIAQESNPFEKKVACRTLFGSNLVLANREARLAAPNGLDSSGQNQWAALRAAHEMASKKSKSQVLVRARGVEPRS